MMMLKLKFLHVVVISYMVAVYECAVTLPKGIVIPAVLILGDSIVDPGNNNYLPTYAKSNFPPYGIDFPGGVPTGRYSNGKVPSDIIVEELGIKELLPPYLDPSLQISDLRTGVSFASGGAGYDPLSAVAASALTLEDQLKLFKEYIGKLKVGLGENTTSSIISQSLYVVFSGSNDITNTYMVLRREQYDISTYTSMMVNWAANFVKELYALGARRIGVTNLPPCGCLPSQRTLYGGLSRECGATENEAAVLYNKKISPVVKSLNQKLPGSIIADLDIFTPLLDLINNPSHYGFKVANKGCCGTGKIEVLFLCSRVGARTCPNRSEYVFWDSYHPTEAAYRIIVKNVIQQVLAQVSGHHK